MKNNSELPMSKKMSRLGKVKKNLEDANYASIHEAASCLKNGQVASALLRHKVVKLKDGVYHWVGGKVTKNMAETLYESAKKKVKSYGKKKIQPKTKPEVIEATEPEDQIVEESGLEKKYSNADVMNMIEEFAKMVSDVNAEIKEFKIAMHDYTRALSALEKRSCLLEVSNRAITEQMESVLETKITNALAA